MHHVAIAAALPARLGNWRTAFSKSFTLSWHTLDAAQSFLFPSKQMCSFVAGTSPSFMLARLMGAPLTHRICTIIFS